MVKLWGIQTLIDGAPFRSRNRFHRAWWIRSLNNLLWDSPGCEVNSNSELSETDWESKRPDFAQFSMHLPHRHCSTVVHLAEMVTRKHRIVHDVEQTEKMIPFITSGRCLRHHSLSSIVLWIAQSNCCVVGPGKFFHWFFVITTQFTIFWSLREPSNFVLPWVYWSLVLMKFAKTKYRITENVFLLTLSIFIQD